MHAAFVRLGDIGFAFFELRPRHFEHAAIGANNLDKAFLLIEKAPTGIAPAARAQNFAWLRLGENMQLRHARLSARLRPPRNMNLPIVIRQSKRSAEQMD